MQRLWLLWYALYSPHFIGQASLMAKPQVTTVEKYSLSSMNNNRVWKGRKIMIQYYNLPKRDHMRLKELNSIQ